MTDGVLGAIWRMFFVGYPIAAILHAYDFIDIPTGIDWLLLAAWMLTFGLGLRLAASTVQREKIEMEAGVE